MSSNYDLAFKDYADAAAMCGRLVNEDARDTKWLERLARIYRRFESVLERAARERSEPLDKAVEQYRNEVMARERPVERDKASAPWKQQLQEKQGAAAKRNGVRCACVQQAHSRGPASAAMMPDPPCASMPCPVNSFRKRGGERGAVRFQHPTLGDQAADQPCRRDVEGVVRDL
jgi:hypothetical protein